MCVKCTDAALTGVYKGSELFATAAEFPTAIVLRSFRLFIRYSILLIIFKLMLQSLFCRNIETVICFRS